jgi:hypothetical protein
VKLHPLHVLGLVLVATLQADCTLECRPPPCESGLNVLGWCAASKTCRLNGQLVTDCEAGGTTPECPLWHFTNGSRVEIPFDEVWPLLVQSNDLSLRWNSYYVNESHIELLFDGAPATDGMCTPTRTANIGEIECINVPRSLKLLEFRLNLPAGSEGSEHMDLYVYDKECADTHQGCY